MYGILDLDASLWTARKDIVGVILEHPQGTSLSVRMQAPHSQHVQGWHIVVRTASVLGTSTLVCPAHGDLVLGPDLVPRILAHIRAVAGPEVPQRLQDMHTSVRTAIILSGHVGEIVLTRERNGEPDWIFYDMDGHYMGSSQCMSGVTPFGPYQGLVNSLAVDIHNLAAPNTTYTGDSAEMRDTRYWTHQGCMSWDFTYTQHERLDLLAAQETTAP